MNYSDYYKILQNFILENKKHWNFSYISYLDMLYTNFTGKIYEPYLVIYTYDWTMWQDLLKKYSHDELSDYLVEVIREELPQLKGIRLYIHNSTNIILDLPKTESDKFLYII